MLLMKKSPLTTSSPKEIPKKQNFPRMDFSPLWQWSFVRTEGSSACWKSHPPWDVCCTAAGHAAPPGTATALHKWKLPQETNQLLQERHFLKGEVLSRLRALPSPSRLTACRCTSRCKGGGCSTMHGGGTALGWKCGGWVGIHAWLGVPYPTHGNVHLQSEEGTAPDALTRGPFRSD